MRRWWGTPANASNDKVVVTREDVSCFLNNVDKYNILVFWILIILAVCLFAWVLWYAVDKVIRNSGATKAALNLVENNIEVMNLLGAPLKIGFWISGSISVGMGLNLFLAPRWRGVASLSLPLAGGRTEGRLKVKLEKKNGAWEPYFARIRIGDTSVLLIDRGGPQGWVKRLFSRDTS